MAQVIIHGIDRDSSAVYTKEFVVNESLRENIEDFETQVPFSRYYTDWEVDTEELTTLECFYMGEAGLDIDRWK